MKITLSVAAMLLPVFGSFASDGTISFLYFATGTATDRPITYAGVPAGSNYTVGLFAGDQTSSSFDSATPLATVSIFGNTGLFQYGGGDIAIPGSTPNQRTVLTIKVYDGATYASSTVRALDVFTTQPLGGSNANPPPPAFPSPDLSGPLAGIGFHGLELITPEPSTYALATLGLGAIALAHRRKNRL